MKRCTSIYIAIFALLSTSAFGIDLQPPIGLPSAKTLPRGVRNLSYKGVNMGASNKFNNQGQGVVLANPLCREWEFQMKIF